MLLIILWMVNKNSLLNSSKSPQISSQQPQQSQSPQSTQPSQVIIPQPPSTFQYDIIKSFDNYRPNKVYDVLQSFGIQKINTEHKDFKLIGTLYNTPTPPNQKVILNLYRRNTKFLEKPSILYLKDPYNDAKYLVQDKDGFFTPLQTDIGKRCLKNGDIITDIPPFTDQGPFTVQLYEN